MAHCLRCKRAATLVPDGGQGDRVIGVLTQAGVPAALSRQGPQAAVRDLMQTDLPMADSHEVLETVLERLDACICHMLPVTYNGKLVGLVTMDNLGEFLRIQAAFTSRRPPRAGPSR